MATRPSQTIERLYAPQFEQFGFALEPNGCVYTGSVDNELGHGSAWAMPISSSCVIVEHNITPARDMLLAEETPRPYACVTQVNESTIGCIPQVGIDPVEVARHGDAPGRNTAGADCLSQRETAVISFLQEERGVKNSPLKKGCTYSSHSVMFFSDYFAQLDAAYPREFSGLFESFATQWNDEASAAICTALQRLSFRHASSPGARLYMKSVVETMTAQLAASHAASEQARRTAGSIGSKSLAQQACALAEKLLDEGHAPSVEELANRLYVSRSKLCATFASEMGEGAGEYVRRRRIERAQTLLADGDASVAQIAEMLGYARTSAFSQAFHSCTGMSPTAWRKEMR